MVWDRCVTMLLCMKGLRALCPRMGGQKGSLSRMWGDQNHHTSLSRSARGSGPLGIFAACLGPEWWQRLGWGCSPRSQQGLRGPSSAPRPTQLPGGRAMIVPIFKARKSSSSED